MSAGAGRGPRESAVRGVLLGTAIGDALGLAMEGMAPEAIDRRFNTEHPYHFLGETGYVSDDTQQSLLLVEAGLASGFETDAWEQGFRRRLLGWFFQMPWGLGMATLRACLRILFLRRPTGVMSAGNGAAMRAPILGALSFPSPPDRWMLGRRLAEVTHRHPMAVDGALFAAELSAGLVSGFPPDVAFEIALQLVGDEPLFDALTRAWHLAEEGKSVAEAAQELGTSGYVLESLPFATFVFLKMAEDVEGALMAVTRAGGDTDTNGAMVGAWLGAYHGAGAFPRAWVTSLQEGPYGRSHILALARAAARGEAAPGWSGLWAGVRNLLLLPVVYWHGFRRLF